MAGTATTAVSKHRISPLNKYTIAWTAHTDGSVSATIKGVIGTIIRVVFDPAANAPDDNYDVTLTDEHGIDVLAGQGANLDTANSSNVVPGVPLKDGTTTSVAPMVVAGDLTLAVSNAGSENQGTITIYTR